jgi:hypothetical protein
MYPEMEQYLLHQSSICFANYYVFVLFQYEKMVFRIITIISYQVFTSPSMSIKVYGMCRLQLTSLLSILLEPMLSVLSFQYHRIL